MKLIFENNRQSLEIVYSDGTHEELSQFTLNMVVMLVLEYE